MLDCYTFYFFNLYFNLYSKTNILLSLKKFVRITGCEPVKKIISYYLCYKLPGRQMENGRVRVSQRKCLEFS